MNRVQKFLTEDFTDTVQSTGASPIAAESGNPNVQFGYYHDVLASSSRQ